MKDFLFDFLNGPWIPAIMIIAGILIFAIVYYRTEKQVNAYRKDIQQKIVNGLAFGEYFNFFREPVYALGEKEKKFITSLGQPVSLPDDKPLELIFHKLGADSQIPSNGYAVICEKTDVRKSDNALLLFFCPANHSRAEWTVIFNDKKQLVCEHHQMGRLTIDSPTDKNLRTGDVITLMSVVRSAKENLLLFSDKPAERPLVLRYEIL